MERQIAGATILDARSLSQIAVTTTGKAVQRYMFYSILQVPAGGGSITQLPFFSTPQGSTQTVGGTALTMDRTRTNIQKANAIGTPNDFILKAIRLWVEPDADGFASAATNLADMRKILCDGYFKLSFGEREHLVLAPPLVLSSGMGLDGFACGDEETLQVNNGHPLIFRVEPWVLIPSELTFRAEINYASAITPTSEAEVGLILDGDLIRSVS